VLWSMLLHARHGGKEVQPVTDNRLLRLLRVLA
jgi:hypothetical protein